MTTKEKKEFIGIHLFHIVTALDTNIISVLYERIGFEFVVLGYGRRKVRINITGDDAFEITKKVLEVVENEVKRRGDD